MATIFGKGCVKLPIGHSAKQGIPTFRGAFVFLTKVSRPSDSFRNLDVAEGTKLEAEGEGGGVQDWKWKLGRGNQIDIVWREFSLME